MYQCILKLSSLVAFASALALNPPRPVHQDHHDFTDIKAIMSTDTSSFKSYPASALPRGNHNTNSSETGGVKHWTCNPQAQFTWGDNAAGGAPGIFITNDATHQGVRGFYVYHNLCDSVPYKYIWIQPGDTRFVSLPALFEGRVSRGVDAWNLGGMPQILATWFELALNREGWAWSDLSLIRGCDGGVVIWATDGSGAWKGFSHSILEGAPPEAYARKDSGTVVLRETTNWDRTINPAVRDWELRRVGPDHAYVDDYHGNPVIASTNGRFATWWAAGRP